MNSNKTKYRSIFINQDGQLSIFLGIALLIVMSLIAFIVNVGLFVKAKINLQNAVDAAAWSGAAVQARQLSNIAYLNYEFRQIFKEWMFKYYVLGNFGSNATINPNFPTLGRSEGLMGGDGNATTFRAIKPSYGAAGAAIDKYNLPSVCLHFGGTNTPNICNSSTVPGLPRFETVELPNITQQNKQFIDAMVDKKNEDCSKRSNLNFVTALTWIYGAGAELMTGVSQVAAQRLGAWPKAIMTAIRMRNLEAIVNRPPVPVPICLAETDGACIPIDTLKSRQASALTMPYNERPIKAFEAAFRNLGGGDKKSNVRGDNADMDRDELGVYFQLTEIPPTPIQVSDNTLSGYLIPQNVTFPVDNSDISLSTKHYLDLQIVPVNYVNFYSHFLAKQASGVVLDPGDPAFDVDGACDKLKVGIPVPAYISGFVKNHQVMTYYSVKGETRFMGLFFPFYANAGAGLQIKAYASAKPFGGRIGPRLFDPSSSGGPQAHDSEQAIARTDTVKSAYYIGSITPPPGGTRYEAGDPLPKDPNFYIGTGSNIVGGAPSSTGTNPVFSVPNMIYGSAGASFDFNSIGTQEWFQLTDSSPSETGGFNPVGLYDYKQYEYFLNNTLMAPDAMNGSPTTALTAQVVMNAILNTRKPTRYEAANWMIPLKHDNNDTTIGAPTTVITPNPGIDPNNGDLMWLYAPLVGPGTLYENETAITDVLISYLKANEPSMNVFLNALKAAADDTLQSGADSGAAVGGAGQEDYEKAAQSIYPLNPGPVGSRTTATLTMASKAVFEADCAGSDSSLASKFYHFLKADDEVEFCGIVPLRKMLREAIANGVGDPNAYQFHPEYYQDFYRDPTEVALGGDLKEENNLFSNAYYPGPAHGSSSEIFISPISSSGSGINVKRNYYSTKLVHTEKLFRTSNGNAKPFADQEYLYNEIAQGNNNFQASGLQHLDSNKNLINFLDDSVLQEFRLPDDAGAQAGALAY